MPETNVMLGVDTDIPQTKALVDAMHDAQEGTTAKTLARADLLNHLAANEYVEAGYRMGYRDGHDAGAAPFLEGPWWRRAWTAARS